MAGPPSPEVSVDSTEPTLSRALRVWPHSERWDGYVHSGWDVFGIPHGGYLAALAANAGLQASGASDVLTITTHFLSKATVGPIHFEVRALGGGRRLSSYLVEASQEGRTRMSSMLSVGDRTQLSGPTFQQRTAPDLDDRLSGPAGSAGEPFPTPRIAQLLGMRVDRESQGFAEGRVGEEAVLRAAIDPVAPTATDQLLAIVACDATPPAAWNALGLSGWVPTVELTVHVRARPAPGTLRVVASTRSVTDGLLEEDAEVYDDAGALVVLSRQLARWTEMEG